MNTSLFIFQTLAPLLVLVSIGFGAHKSRIIQNSHVAALTRFTNDVCVPVIFIRLLSRATAPDTSTLTLISVYNITILIIFALSFFLARSFLQNKNIATFVGFGTIFSNTFLLGVPLAITIFGEQLAIPYLVIISIDILVVFSLILILLEIQNLPQKLSLPKKIITLSQKIIKNPIIIGILIGSALNLSSTSLHPFVDSIALSIQHMNTPLATIALGACLSQLGIRTHILLSLAVALAKVILVPALTLVLIILVGNVPALWAQSLLLMASLPVGISVFVFASRYDTAQNFAASTIFISTLLSPFSLAILLSLFEHWDLFISFFS
jgi:predicted permease